MNELALDNTRCSRKFCFVHAMGTDAGLARKENQDCFGYAQTREADLYLIADGMGGVRGGAIASGIATNLIARSLLVPGSEIQDEQIKQIVASANREIFSFANKDRTLAGMGTTLCCLILYGEHVKILHVGDSRIYHLSSNQFKQLTNDHTLVQELLRNGTINSHEANNHPISHVLSRSLGPKEEVEVEITELSSPIAVGDKFLLCSDGLYGMVSEEEIKNILINNSPQDAVEFLIGASLNNGGKDNVTVQVVEVIRKEISDPTLLRTLPQAKELRWVTSSSLGMPHIAKEVPEVAEQLEKESIDVPTIDQIEEKEPDIEIICEEVETKEVEEDFKIDQALIQPEDPFVIDSADISKQTEMELLADYVGPDVVLGENAQELHPIENEEPAIVASDSEDRNEITAENEIIFKEKEEVVEQAEKEEVLTVEVLQNEEDVSVSSIADRLIPPEYFPVLIKILGVFAILLFFVILALSVDLENFATRVGKSFFHNTTSAVSSGNIKTNKLQELEEIAVLEYGLYFSKEPSTLDFSRLIFNLHVPSNQIYPRDRIATPKSSDVSPNQNSVVEAIQSNREEQRRIALKKSKLREQIAEVDLRLLGFSDEGQKLLERFQKNSGQILKLLTEELGRFEDALATLTEQEREIELLLNKYHSVGFKAVVRNLTDAEAVIPAHLSMLEEAEKRYDETMADWKQNPSGAQISVALAERTKEVDRIKILLSEKVQKELDLRMSKTFADLGRSEFAIKRLQNFIGEIEKNRDLVVRNVLSNLKPTSIEELILKRTNLYQQFSSLEQMLPTREELVVLTSR